MSAHRMRIFVIEDGDSVNDKKSDTLQMASSVAETADARDASPQRSVARIEAACLLATIGRALLVLTSLALVVPWNPAMPGAGLDPSWAFGLNQAVAQGLVFGKDIVFTLGPYASVFTKSFHPATDSLMLLGSGVLAICYAGALFYASSEVAWWLPLALAITLAGTVSRDILLMVYPLVVTVVHYRAYRRADADAAVASAYLSPAATFVIFVPFGLLPLVKGSLLPACAVGAVLCMALFVSRGDRLRAALTLLATIASILFFWAFAHQPLAALPAYFASQLAMISGYEEGMALDGPAVEIVYYVVPAMLLLMAIGLRHNGAPLLRWFLALSFAAFLCLAFKAGFVRHDAHALISASAIIVAALLYAIAMPSRLSMALMLISAAAGWKICSGYGDASPMRLAVNVEHTFADVRDGLHRRLADGHGLQQAYLQRLADLRREHDVPALKGTSDIYSFWQSDLLAAGDAWSPRPVLQSYAAYTPTLAVANAAHLLSNLAPRNVLIRVTPIDLKYPSLDDGPSWPVLMRDYRPVAFSNNFLYLLRAVRGPQPPVSGVATDVMESLGERVVVPASANPLFANFDLQPTLLGRLRAVLFKPVPLHLTVMLHDGTKQTYKLVSGMAKAGFLLTPLVRNSTDFAYLYGNHERLRDQDVVSFVVAPDDGGAYAWNVHYGMSLSAVASAASPEVARLFSYDPVGGLAPADVSLPHRQQVCVGGLDVLNETYPAPSRARISDVLSAEGWLVADPATMTTPERIYLTLTDIRGMVRYVETRRTPRVDVRDALGARALPNLGYTAYLDPTQFKGVQVLGLAYSRGTQFITCKQFNVPLAFAH